MKAALLAMLFVASVHFAQPAAGHHGAVEREESSAAYVKTMGDDLNVLNIRRYSMNASQGLPTVWIPVSAREVTLAFETASRGPVSLPLEEAAEKLQGDAEGALWEVQVDQFGRSPEEGERIVLTTYFSLPATDRVLLRIGGPTSAFRAFADVTGGAVPSISGVPSRFLIMRVQEDSLLYATPPAPHLSLSGSEVIEIALSGTVGSKETSKVGVFAAGSVAGGVVAAVFQRYFRRV